MASVSAKATSGAAALVNTDSLERGINNIIEQKSLKWIFVGGKGGVGKTTTSCSLAVTLAKHRDSVLIISTDPAHNLSDAFGQKFSKNPTPVNGVSNLFAMEIDPTIEIDNPDILDQSTQSFLADMTGSIPGIDEAMSFAELIRQVQSMNYSVIVFDTAPTGHTLRLLSFPSLLEKAFEKIAALKNRFSGVFQQVQGLINQTGQSEEQILGKLESLKTVIAQVNAQFKSPDATTFVCVCIPEFLSLFETERLVQELSKFEIDTHNIVVNQVLMPEKDSNCKKCAARVRMQKKYLDQIMDLYEDFHITVMPLLDEEVRGLKGLTSFGQMLQNPVAPSQ